MVLMYDNIFSNRLDVHNLSLLEDTFVVIMFYVFVKLLFLGSIIDLIWPTHFFNLRNSSLVSNNCLKARKYTDYFVKLNVKFNLGFKIIAAKKLLLVL